MLSNPKFLFVLSVLFLFAVNFGWAQGPPPIPTVDAPLDPASLSVLIGGGAYALKKMNDKRKANNNYIQ
jgi:hypothetical protein